MKIAHGERKFTSLLESSRKVSQTRVGQFNLYVNILGSFTTVALPTASNRQMNLLVQHVMAAWIAHIKRCDPERGLIAPSVQETKKTEETESN